MKRTSVILGMVALIVHGLGSVPAGFAYENLKLRRVLIGFKAQAGPQARAEVVYAAGAEVNHSYHLLPVVSALLTDDAIERLRTRPDVAYVEEDGRVYAVEQTTPWGVDRIDADLVWGVHHGNAGAGVDVAVLDTGIDYDHPDLAVAGGVNCIGQLLRDGSTKREDWDDPHGHGTHCAGVIAALNNEIGVVGVAPEANLWAVKVLSEDRSGYVSDVIQGLEWCVDNQMEVASMSFRGADSRSMKNACDVAYQANVLLVAATGNDSGPVQYPAAYASVIAVSAIDSAGGFCGFANRGPETELTAPGVNVHSTFSKGGYKTLSGTSMACPHVAGVAALVWASSELGLSSAEGVRARLQETAEDLTHLAPEEQGYGLVDADRAVGSQLPVVVDLAITGVLSPDQAIQGDLVEVTVTVENAGNRDVVDDISVTLVAESAVDAVTIDTLTLSGGLTAGASGTLTYAWPTGDAPIGDCRLVARHDMVDDDETNDSLAAHVTVAASVADIAITAVDTAGSARQGDTLSVDVTVENTGNRDITKYVQVMLASDNTTPGDTFDDITIGIQTLSRGLAAGTSATLGYTWRLTRAAAGCHTLTASHKTADDNIDNDSFGATVCVSELRTELTVTRISPHIARAEATVSAIIMGSGFTHGATVTFENGYGPPPTALGVAANGSSTLLVKITTGRSTPAIATVWDVRVTNPDGSSAVLPEAFTVRP